MRIRVAVLLVLVGAICLAWVAIHQYREASFQHEQEQLLERTPRSAAPRTRERLPREALIGRLEIPRVHLSAMVVEGDDEKLLAKAVGHLPDTVLPWESGNSALAGHRDSFFRPLEGVRIGDEVRLTSPRGVFVYRVIDTFVTSPTDVGILRGHGRNELTLVTCYPFTYIGNAPKRFIVRAERDDVLSRRAASPPPGRQTAAR